MPQFHYDAKRGGAQPAMVMVKRGNGVARYLAAVNDCGMAFEISSDLLHPMPPTITPEQEAVLRAAEKQNIAAHSSLYSHEDYLRACDHTNNAVDELRATLVPADPVAEVKAAWHELLRNKSFQHDAVGRMADAIAALEAKS